MSGIVFLKCRSLERAKEFYIGTIGMKVWLEQPSICILRHGNMLLGFHEAGEVDDGCLITFFYDTKAEVDAMHSTLADKAAASPG
jgi:catechol 2,3-dioxygenase-like lactoylglutathione lyase family enzyme